MAKLEGSQQKIYRLAGYKIQQDKGLAARFGKKGMKEPADMSRLDGGEPGSRSIGAKVVRKSSEGRQAGAVLQIRKKWLFIRTGTRFT